MLNVLAAQHMCFRRDLLLDIHAAWVASKRHFRFVAAWHLMFEWFASRRYLQQKHKEAGYDPRGFASFIKTGKLADGKSYRAHLDYHNFDRSRWVHKPGKDGAFSFDCELSALFFSVSANWRRVIEIKPAPIIGLHLVLKLTSGLPINTPMTIKGNLGFWFHTIVLARS